MVAYFLAPQVIFLSTLSLRRATLIFTTRHMAVGVFLSTLSLRRATLLYAMGYHRHGNFYPRSPCGERPMSGTDFYRSAIISIHALLAESDPTQYARRNAHMYFYPRSPCGERPRSAGLWLAECTISIHALLAESDLIFAARHMAVGVFLSTLSLRRATTAFQKLMAALLQFLSTLSLRRATLAGPSGPAISFNFYPRSPCGERQ